MLEGLLPVALAVDGGDVALAADLVLVDHEALEADGAAGVDLVGADADLGAEAVAHAVGEARGGVPVDARGVDAGHEPLGARLRARQDDVRVLGAVGVDVGNGFVETGNGFHG